ncbi:MAG: hypothetical protein IJF22_02185 [Clostridia bacterium]|nr:hypothetical protein [Clostridia bacterium]
MKYFRITGYCPEHDFSFIVDACGKFEKLWQFSSFLLLRNLKVFEVCESDKIQSSNIDTPTDDKKHILLRACQEGQPTITNQDNKKIITVAKKMYVTK